MRRQTGRNTRPHTQFPSSFLGMSARMTSQVNKVLIYKQRGPLMFVAYFLTYYSWSLYKQALADVRSTGAGIKCLYCSLRIKTIRSVLRSSMPGRLGADRACGCVLSRHSVQELNVGTVIQYAQTFKWHSGMPSGKILGLPAHLEHKLKVYTV